MKKYNLTFLGIILALIAGCATASFTQTGQAFPEYDGIVKVFAEAPEDLDYTQVGLVSSKGGNIHSSTDLIKALQKEAAKHGANAIILVSNEETNRPILTSNQFGTYAGSATTKEMTAIAIRIIK